MIYLVKNEGRGGFAPRKHSTLSYNPKFIKGKEKKHEENVEEISQLCVGACHAV